MGGQITRKQDTPPPGTAHPDAVRDDLNNLVLLYNAGRLEEAETTARALLIQFPDNAALHDIHGGVLLGQGKNEQAEARFRALLDIDPGHAGAHSNLALALKKQGRREEAVASFRAALAIRPDFAEVHSNLGNVLLDLGRLEEAGDAYRQAIELRPGLPEAHANLGVALRGMGRLDEAVSAFVAALKLRSAFPKALVDLGETLHLLGKYDQARVSAEQAVKMNPQHAQAHHLLGKVYERLNRMDKATEHSATAVALTPGDPAVNLSRAVVLRREGKPDEAISALLPLSEEEGEVPDALLSQVNNELGKLYDQRGDAGAAFRYFMKANELQARSPDSAAFDKRAFLEQVADAANVLTPEWVAGWRLCPLAADAEIPAFIVGFPRSGTTLLDQVLDSHPAFQVMEERPVLGELIARINGTYGGYPDVLARLEPGDVGALREAYFSGVDDYIRREAGTLLVDKFPLHIRHLPLIARLFPDARAILAMRHPCDVVLSCFMQRFRINSAMANFFTLEDAAHCYAQVMGLWRKCAGVLPLRYHTVTYENLVSDFETEVRGAIEFLGAAWDDAVFDYTAHARERGAINTPSYEAVTRPVNDRAMYRWKRYEDKLAPVMGTLKPFIGAFGYA